MIRLYSISILLIFLFVGSTSLAQETTVRDYPMDERALLWKIEGDGVKNDCYLFGTVHLIEENQFFFPKKLQKIVGKSDVLTMEIAGIPNQMEALKLSMLKEGSFFDFFNEDQIDSMLIWVETHTSFNENTFKLMVGKMRPFLVSQLLAELDESNPNAGMDTKKSYEVEFEAIAKDKKVLIQGLETVEDQLAIFDHLTNDEQADLVMEVIRDTSGSANEELDRIMELYAAQDIDGLFALIAESTQETAGFNDLILNDRNKRWIPLIEKMISEKSTFIAVGAGHIGGPTGVLRLLEARGYTLTPIEL